MKPQRVRAAIAPVVTTAAGSRPVSHWPETGRCAGTSRGAENQRAIPWGVCGAFVLALVLLAMPATAGARTITQDLEVAHRYWKTDICRGEWKVIPDESIRARGALASTFMRDCTIYVLPELRGCDRESALLHEVGHFVHGRAHSGPMSGRVLERVPCVGERLRVARVKARWLRDRERIRRWWR